MQFAKYHGLGNDYLVIEPTYISAERARYLASKICHRNYGVGSDGLLLGPSQHESADFGLRIINPDGSEAEKSGNGLRIFARYLWDTGQVKGEPFTIHTPGGIARAQVDATTQKISVTMGIASFDSQKIGISGEPRLVVGETMHFGKKTYCCTAVTVGNPHCVVLGTPVTEEVARSLGPLIEGDPRFLNRTNVQLMRIADEHNLEIQIWERGAGYTLASGSSASAAACAALRLNLCKSPVAVHMPGGTLAVEIDNNYHVTQTGPAERICGGVLSAEVLSDSGGPWAPLSRTT